MQHLITQLKIHSILKHFQDWLTQWLLDCLRWWLRESRFIWCHDESVISGSFLHIFLRIRKTSSLVDQHWFVVTACSVLSSESQCPICSLSGIFVILNIRRNVKLLLIVSSGSSRLLDTNFLREEIFDGLVKAVFRPLSIFCCYTNDVRVVSIVNCRFRRSSSTLLIILVNLRILLKLAKEKKQDTKMNQTFEMTHLTENRKLNGLLRGNPSFSLDCPFRQEVVFQFRSTRKRRIQFVESLDEVATILWNYIGMRLCNLRW